ncbi:MAG: hypothetical protein HY727_04540 [Candidatus Rokubacteria bacterium]|nr:hypothetical protein [Candidatus Rokubacteria bacterium]
MSILAELEQFVRQHRACGTLSQDAASPLGGGYLLAISCSCGATFDRWVTAGEKEIAEKRRDEILREPLPSKSTQPSRDAPSGGRSEAPTLEATHLPGATPSPKLEEALKAALEAPEAQEAPARRPPPGPSPKLEDALKAALQAPDVPEPPGRPGAPSRPALDEAARAAQRARLDEALRRAMRMPEAAEPRRRRSSFTFARGVILLAAVLLGGAFWYGVQSRNVPPEDLSSAPAGTAGPRLSESERKSVVEALQALKELQNVSRVGVPYQLYARDLSFARPALDRYLQTDGGDLELKSTFREIMALHALASSAWQAKAVNDKARWERVGEDPATEFCAPVKRILEFAEEPVNMSRAQWRGLAVAAVIPLLWECASGKAGEVERSLRDR